MAVLIFGPKGNLVPIVIYIILEALSYAIVLPRKDSLLVLSVRPEERARTVALMTSFTIAFSSPFGYFSGFLSSVDRRLPFAFSLVLYLLALLISFRIKEPENAESA
jgi:hypothetical protein